MGREIRHKDNPADPETETHKIKKYIYKFKHKQKKNEREKEREAKDKYRGTNPKTAKLAERETTGRAGRQVE